MNESMRSGKFSEDATNFIDAPMLSEEESNSTPQGNGPAPPTSSVPAPPANMTQQAETGDSSGQPPLKRQRVSQACGTCRDRKTRCDGAQPVCRACQQRGVAASCRYDQVKRQRARPSYNDSPQHPPQQPGPQPDARTADPRAHNDAAQALSDLGRGACDDRRNSILKTSPIPLHAAYQTGNGLTSRTNQAFPGSELPAPRADGLATVAAGSDDSIYGPSSTVAFLKHVMPSQSGTATPVNGSESTFRSSGAVPERIQHRTDGLAVLPVRRQADNFVLCYWEFIHPLFPVLHKPSFTRKYDRLWTEGNDAPHHDSEAEEAIFTATLNLVFALGCKFSTLVEPSQHSSVADDFYQRSRQSYPFDILDSTSISLVQMLVLGGVYLQSTQHASRCWNSVGLAIRMAQSLGLHVDAAGHRGISQLALHMRRRIWHTCVNLDRLLSMTFGRPSMIDRTIEVPIPALIDDEWLQEHIEGAQPAGIPSRLGLFVSSCRLFELLEEILSLFYRDSSGVSSQRQANGATKPTELLAPVLDLNRRLDQFVEGVPAYLRIPDSEHASPSKDDHVHLQQQVLYCRFLYIRLLCLRPLLLMATRLDSKPHSLTLDTEVIRSCCDSCTLTACRLIDTLYDNLGTLYRSSGWHTVYFTFASAIVLLASSKTSSYRPQIAERDVEGSWSRCFYILEHYENQIPSARHASRLLRSMKARVSDIAREHHSNHTQEPGDATLDPFLQPAKPEAASNGTALSPAIYPQLSLEEIEALSADISQSWFGQQLVNLDWLELRQI